jgi:hypothetical protein
LNVTTIPTNGTQDEHDRKNYGGFNKLHVLQFNGHKIRRFSYENVSFRLQGEQKNRGYAFWRMGGNCLMLIRKDRTSVGDF